MPQSTTKMTMYGSLEAWYEHLLAINLIKDKAALTRSIHPFGKGREGILRVKDVAQIGSTSGPANSLVQDLYDESRCV